MRGAALPLTRRPTVGHAIWHLTARRMTADSVVIRH